MPFSLNTYRYFIVSLLLLVGVTCTNALASPDLETSGTGFTLDVDGNGEQDALTDGLLIIRALFGFE